LTKFSSKESAIADYVSKWTDKTKNSWSDRNNFKKKDGKYAPVEIDYGNDEEEKKEVKEKSKTPNAPAKVVECKLEKKVQDLISLICNVQNMTETLLEMEFDLKKMPLGKITKKQVEMGYLALKELENAIVATPNNHARLTELSNKFYT